jgi:hypothetical protein
MKRTRATRRYMCAVVTPTAEAVRPESLRIVCA